MKHCDNCQNELKQVFPDMTDVDYQFDNALVIGLFGGYGMFIESARYAGEPCPVVLKDTGATREIFLCHDCAHELCDKFPAFGSLVNPYDSHTHTVEYWETHPDHEGIDKKD